MYRITGIRVAMVAVTLIGGHADAASVDGSLELVPDVGSFEETFDPSVNVSGQLLTGIMYPPIDSGPGLAPLGVDFAIRQGLAGEKVCFRLASRDGVYTAKWSSTLPSASTESAQVRFESRHRSELERAGAENLVALASIGQGCESRAPVYLPTHWGFPPASDPPARPGSLIVYLNTDASEVKAAARYRETDAISSSACTILPSTVDTTTFDTLCELSLLDGETPVELAVLRQNFSSMLPPLRYPLAN